MQGPRPAKIAQGDLQQITLMYGAFCPPLSVPLGNIFCRNIEAFYPFFFLRRILWRVEGGVKPKLYVSYDPYGS